jgi:hypothetical protein
MSQDNEATEINLSEDDLDNVAGAQSESQNGEQAAHTGPPPPE